MVIEMCCKRCPNVFHVRGMRRDWAKWRIWTFSQAGRWMPLSECGMTVAYKSAMTVGGSTSYQTLPNSKIYFENLNMGINGNSFCTLQLNACHSFKPACFVANLLAIWVTWTEFQPQDISLLYRTFWGSA